ncbi:ATP-dependent Clp protease ATP-binding subunit ClpX, partial [Lecanoromycetidae sp. Uapishka_2]
MSTVLLPVAYGPPRPQARLSYLSLSAIYRSLTTTAAQRSSSQFRRSDFTGQPFTGSYEPGGRTSGPLGDASVLGVPSMTPKVLKQHLDNFVVGQERAKKVLSVAVFNHYQRIQESQRLEDEEQELLQQQLRREMAEAHPLEDEYPGHQQAIPLHPPSSGLGAPPIHDPSPLTLEKANILLLGPSGVGKTLMAKTLARVLAVPFSMSDCTPFTQAGYIGEDAEICVQRLLAAANYDVAAAERGIICLDEIDKISSAKVSHGKDVGGEGVQQALLKIIEGTTLQIQAKQEKSARGPGSSTSSYPTNSPLSGGMMGGPSSGSSGSGNTSSGPSKSETYNVRTDNILFICAGAFVGLQKTVMNRIARGSIGFGSPIRSSSNASGSSAGNRDTTISVKTGSEESKMFEKHLPFFSTQSPDQAPLTEYNPLDLVEPTDLQNYGLIPELVGRIPVSAALSALDEEALVRVLTEPRNSLMRQYEQLFQLSGVELRFTRGALREVAKSALDMGTGARGLRTVCERLLTETMFEAPGSSINYVLITQAVAQRKSAPIYLSRGQQHRFQSLIAAEEEEWDAKNNKDGKKDDEHDDNEGGGLASFQEYREKSTAVGVM